MRRSALALAAPLLLGFAALTAPPALDASAAATTVVEIDECACEAILMFDTDAGDWIPWTLSWSPEQGHENGSCLADACEDKDPRPCKGSFRIHVSWPQVPTPPCVGAAFVSYRPEGQPNFQYQGQLDLSHGFVPIFKAGGNLVICASRSGGAEPYVEPVDTQSEIQLSCPIANNGTRFRLVHVREACIPCNATRD